MRALGKDNTLLYLVRHGISEDLHPDQMDRDRKLTLKGIEKMKLGAEGMKRILDPPQVILTSPYNRTVSTCEIIRGVFHDSEAISSDLLKPGEGSGGITSFLSSMKASRVLLVGHEPGLSRLITFLTTGTESPYNEMKKGALAVLSFSSSIHQGLGTLQCLISPKILRLLAK